MAAWPSGLPSLWPRRSALQRLRCDTEATGHSRAATPLPRNCLGPQISACQDSRLLSILLPPPLLPFFLFFLSQVLCGIWYLSAMGIILCKHPVMQDLGVTFVLVCWCSFTECSFTFHQNGDCSPPAVSFPPAVTEVTRQTLGVERRLSVHIISPSSF